MTRSLRMVHSRLRTEHGDSAGGSAGGGAAGGERGEEHEQGGWEAQDRVQALLTTGLASCLDVAGGGTMPFVHSTPQSNALSAESTGTGGGTSGGKEVGAAAAGAGRGGTVGATGEAKGASGVVAFSSLSSTSKQGPPSSPSRAKGGRRDGGDEAIREGNAATAAATVSRTASDEDLPNETGLKEGDAGKGTGGGAGGVPSERVAVFVGTQAQARFLIHITNSPCGEAGDESRGDATQYGGGGQAGG